MTINDLKYQIFAQIANIQNEEVLKRVKEMLENISKENDLLYRTVKPIRDKITVEDLIREQNYKGFDRDAFNQLVSELNIQDPIEDLLSLSTP